jgi:carbon storage regulator
MLVLSRKIGETVVLPTCGVTIQVVETSASRVKLGITAPGEIPVHRGEVAGRILAGNKPKPPQSRDVDARLADWIKRRTGGRVRSLRVERQPGQVIVHGSANTYYARQLAQQAASEICNQPETGQREEVVIEIEVV